MDREEKLEILNTELQNKDVLLIKETRWLWKSGEDITERTTTKTVLIGDVLWRLDAKVIDILDITGDLERFKKSEILASSILNSWKTKTRPLEEQPDHCVDKVYGFYTKFQEFLKSKTEVKKYRKKPVEIEAVRFTTETNLRKAFPDIEIWNGKSDSAIEVYIKTLEGKMKISEWDYIIKGIKGEYYPCKPDIFEETYQRV